jgi:hypothetical protein
METRNDRAPPQQEQQRPQTITAKRKSIEQFKN